MHGSRVWRAIGAVLLAAALAACGGRSTLPQRAEGRPGGTLTLSLDREPASLDPAHAVDVASARVMAALFDGLTGLDAEGKVYPRLAERWEVSADGRTYRFHLRRGVRFHNGNPLTAEDVAYSFRRLLDPETGSPRAWVLGDIEGADAFRAGLTREVSGIRVVDEDTVELVLARPSATLLLRLAMPAAYVLDAESGGNVAAGTAPPGTGPFRPVTRRQGTEIVAEANGDYFAGAPYLEGVTWRLDLDAESSLRAFADGTLHALEASPPAMQVLGERLRWGGPSLQVTPPAVYYLAINTTRKPLNDPLVRQALNHAVDRQALLDELLPGGYVLANGALPPGVPGHDPQREGYAFDPLMARQLLAQAGLDDGFELTIVEPGSPFVHALNTRIAEMWERVGVRTRVRTVDRQTFERLVDDPTSDVDAFVLSWWADYPDPENVLVPLFHSANAGAGGNRARFSSPEVDRALEELAAGRDEGARAALARQIEEMVFARAPWVPLFFPVRHLVHQAGLHGLDAPAFPHAETYWDVWWDAPPQ